MSAEKAAPCRHAGASPEAVVDRVAQVISSLHNDEAFLASRGLTADEYINALPTVVEALRGRQSASSGDRRRFLTDIFQAMAAKGLLAKIATPSYGDDTVYRLTIAGFGDVAVIQKGCPDGAHSSVRWSAPSWARETYLWWLCSSLKSEPGEHIIKGVNRLRQRFFSSAPDAIDGVIFHNDLCGGPQRMCPKMSKAIIINGRPTPPPCIYVMPERKSDAIDWNWDGDRRRVFPAVLLALFDIPANAAPAYVGYIGFQKRGSELRTTSTSRFGPGRSTTHRY